MKINFSDKGQVKLILILAITVLLSTIILAEIALNETGFIEGGSTTQDANEEDVSIMICGDNQEYNYDANFDIGWSNGESVDSNNGGYKESVLTYEAFPQCVISMEPYEVDMNCLTQYCTQIVRLNQLTGEVKIIWTQGEKW